MGERQRYRHDAIPDSKKIELLRTSVDKVSQPEQTGEQPRMHNTDEYALQGSDLLEVIDDAIELEINDLVEIEPVIDTKESKKTMHGYPAVPNRSEATALAKIRDAAAITEVREDIAEITASEQNTGEFTLEMDSPFSDTVPFSQMEQAIQGYPVVSETAIQETVPTRDLKKLPSILPNPSIQKKPSLFNRVKRLFRRKETNEALDSEALHAEAQAIKNSFLDKRQYKDNPVLEVNSDSFTPVSINRILEKYIFVDDKYGSAKDSDIDRELFSDSITDTTNQESILDYEGQKELIIAALTQAPQFIRPKFLTSFSEDQDVLNAVKANIVRRSAFYKRLPQVMMDRQDVKRLYNKQIGNADTEKVEIKNDNALQPTEKQPAIEFAPKEAVPETKPKQSARDVLRAIEALPDNEKIIFLQNVDPSITSQQKFLESAAMQMGDTTELKAIESQMFTPDVTKRKALEAEYQAIISQKALELAAAIQEDLPEVTKRAA